VIAQFVAGRFWQRATDAERGRFIAALSNHVTDLIATRFTRYTRQSFAVVGEHAEADGSTLVSTAVVEPDTAGGDRVDWRVEKTADGDMKIIDVAVSGVSVAAAKRDEFGSILERDGGGLTALAAALEARSGEPQSSMRRN
jgi:phospholipid transport system substrate-binding protein